MAARGRLRRCLLRNDFADFYPKDFSRAGYGTDVTSIHVIYSLCHETYSNETCRGKQRRGTFGEKSTEKGDLCKYRMDSPPPLPLSRPNPPSRFSFI